MNSFARMGIHGLILGAVCVVVGACGSGGTPENPPPPQTRLTPSDAEVAAALNASLMLPPGSFTIDNPSEDASISLTPPPPGTMKLPLGPAVPGSLSFQAPQGNVQGVGIRFGSTGAINVIPIDGSEGQQSGTFNYSFAVPPEICANLSTICHDIKCYEFAVSSGMQISRANIMDVAVACGGCDEPSCRELLDGCGGGGGAGDVTITLRWDAPVNLDLVVVDPCGNPIASEYTTATCQGFLGQFGVDNQTGGSGAFETVSWGAGAAPSGFYGVGVGFAEALGFTGPVTYTLTRVVDGQTTTDTGTLQIELEEADVIVFQR